MIYINKSTIDNYFIECEDHSVCNEFMSIDDIVFESLVLNGNRNKI